MYPATYEFLFFAEFDMLRNLAISRLVKRLETMKAEDDKRGGARARNMAISRLIKRDQGMTGELPAEVVFEDYGEGSDQGRPKKSVENPFSPYRATRWDRHKNADSPKFAALWKTRVG